ncbi:MAG: PAS domain S-box protein [Marinilabiliaceae bacterium]|nr:PAS domain S-box protein [Marinilabiliaceae bacterium]
MLIRILLWIVAGYALHSMYVNSYLAIKGRALGHFLWLSFFSFCIIGSVLSYFYFFTAHDLIPSLIVNRLTFLFLFLGLLSAVQFMNRGVTQRNIVIRFLFYVIVTGGIVSHLAESWIIIQDEFSPVDVGDEVLGAEGIYLATGYYNWIGAVFYALMSVFLISFWLISRKYKTSYSKQLFVLFYFVNALLLVLSFLFQIEVLLILSTVLLLFSLNGNLAKHIVHDYEVTRKLQYNEFRWHKVADNSSLLIVGVDKDGVIYYVNSYLCTILNLNQTELSGKNWLIDFVNQSDRTRVIDFFWKDKYDSEEFVIFQVKAPNGQVINARWMMVPEVMEGQGGSYWVGSLLPMEKGNVERAFNLQRELDTVINAIPGMFIIFSNTGRVERMNKLAHKFFGDHCPESSNHANGMALCGDFFRCKYCIVDKALKHTLRNRKGIVKMEGALPVVENDLLVRRNVLVSTDIIHPFENVMVYVDDITHLKQCEEKLRLTEDRYETLLQEAPIGIILHKNYEIHYGNPEALKLLEYKSEEELLGKSIFSFIPKDKKKLIMERLGKIETSDGLPPINMPVISSKGKELILNFITTPITLDGEKLMMTLARDITDLVHVKRELETRNELLEEAGDIAGLGRWEFNFRKQLFNFSAQWGRLVFDNSIEHQTSVENLLPIILKQDREEVKRRFSTFIREKYFSSFEFRVQRSDKRIVHLFIDGKIELNSAGGVGRLYGVFQDITTRKVYEEEIIKTKEKAIENDRLKTAFLANLSHEIRTPLNGILGFTEILKKILDSEDHVRYIDVIQESSHQLLHILNDILDYSLIETDQLHVSYRIENINALLMLVYERNNKKAALKGLELTVYTHLPDDLSWFKTDKQKLRRILDQLVSNAIKFTFKGSVRIGYRIMPDSIRFYVSDTGIGIENEKQPYVFNRFWQVDMNYNRQFDGTGLGLSVAKGFVDAMEGNIWMKSSLGMGTTFYIAFPFMKEKHEESADDTASIEKS